MLRSDYHVTACAKSLLIDFPAKKCPRFLKDPWANAHILLLILQHERLVARRVVSRGNGFLGVNCSDNLGDLSAARKVVIDPFCRWLQHNEV